MCRWFPRRKGKRVTSVMEGGQEVLKRESMGRRFKGELKDLVARIHSTEVRQSFGFGFSKLWQELCGRWSDYLWRCVFDLDNSRLDYRILSRSCLTSTGAIHSVYSAQHGEQPRIVRG